MSAVEHLWEIEHPYYGPESCYYATGNEAREAIQEHQSWAEFVEGGDFYDADLDMNFLYRWDWIRDTGEYNEPGDSLAADRLLLFHMGQRKGYMSHQIILVTEADEDAVRQWLTVRAEHMALTWAPLLTAVKA